MKGTIRKRGKDSWQIIFDLPRDVDGKRKQARHTVHGSKKDAEAKLRELLSAVDKGEYVGPNKETVAGYLQRWLDSYATTNTSPRTLKDYRGIVRRYLVPNLGALHLTSLRPDHVQALYADMLSRGLSALTVLHTHRLLREAMSHAVKWRLITRNVCDAVDPPRPQRKQMASLDSTQLGRFFAATKGTPYHDVFFIALYTGLRRSEVLGLRWPEVDLERGTLSVVASLHRLPGQGLVLLPTKSLSDNLKIELSWTPKVDKDEWCHEKREIRR
jgi:integrase